MSLKEKYQQMLEKAKEEVTFYEEMLQLLGRLEESPPQPDHVDHTQVIGNMLDRIDKLGNEVSELRNMVKMRNHVVSSGSTRRAVIESRVNAILDILKSNRRQFDAAELQDLLGLDHVQTISAMREAVRTTGQVRMSQGKRRKLFVTYTGSEATEPIRA